MTDDIEKFHVIMANNGELNARSGAAIMYDKDEYKEYKAEHSDSGRDNDGALASFLENRVVPRMIGDYDLSFVIDNLKGLSGGFPDVSSEGKLKDLMGFFSREFYDGGGHKEIATGVKESLDVNDYVALDGVSLKVFKD